MRDPKSLFILIVALSLVLISFVLISIWGYHFYFAPKENTTSQSLSKAAPPVQKNDNRDSLQRLLDSAIQKLKIQQNSPAYDSTDTLDKSLESKLLEYNKLKEEIAGILKNKSSSPKEMSDAGEKIIQLQQSIDELKNQNDAVAKENARLNKMLKQFIIENNGKNSSINTASKNAHTDNAASPSVLVSHLKFFAVDANKRLTKLASNASIWEGSFEINVNVEKNNSQDIYVEILQPNGKVLLNSAWESGTFEVDSKSKIYSAVLHFDINKDNHRRLYFSIGARSFQKGSYTMLVFHDGVLIGRMERSLG